MNVQVKQLSQNQSCFKLVVLLTLILSDGVTCAMCQ